MKEFDVGDFDRFLSDSHVAPSWIIVHPKIYTGYWNIRPYPRWIRILFRFLGRKLHNKYLYWIGLPVYWQVGLKEIL